MKLLYKIFRQDPDTREGVVTTVSGLGILVNLLVAAVKVAVGTLVNSIAVVSEGVNNASDAATSVLTIVGTKLSGKRPTKKHPFGFGRVEYLTSLIIAGLICVTGFEVLKESVKLIFNPADMSDFSWVTMAIVAGTAAMKLALALYTIHSGKRVDSGVLVALGTDCRNDCIGSVVTLISGGAFLLFGWKIDGVAGLFTSVIILKAGIEILGTTVSDLLGKAGEKELASTIYKEIRKTPGVLNAADMMLHNYGPDAYSGSVNIEIDHEKTVGEIYKVIHDLQLRIMHEHHVTMVFGMYAVDRDHEDAKEMRTYITRFVRDADHVVSFHALYLPPDSDSIYVDLVVDYDLKDWDKLKSDFIAYMDKKYPGRPIELTVETEFV